jgi:hypothetical protein
VRKGGLVNRLGSVRKRCLICLSAALFCAAPVSPATAADEKVDLAFLRSRFERHVEILSRAIVEFAGDGTRTSLESNEILGSDGFEGRIDVSATAKSYHFHGKFWQNAGREQIARPTAVTMHEVLVTPDRWLLVDHDANSRKKANGNRFGMSAKLKMNGDEWIGSLADQDLGILFGCMPRGFSNSASEQRLCDVLNSVQCTFIPDTGDKNDRCVGILGKADRFEIQIIFSAETDFSVKRISVTQAETGVKPGGPYNCTLEILESQQSEGRYVPGKLQIRHSRKGGTIKRLIVPPDKFEDFHVAPTVVVTNYSIGSILLGNDAAPMSFDLREEVPDGTFVSVKDAGHLRYVWREGRVVPDFSEQIAARADSVKVQEAPSNWRVWLFSANFLVVCTIGSVVYYRRRRQR